MISQNTKHLTIKQIKALIANNGIVENIDKAKKQKRPVEYCLEALNQALADRLAKSHAKYESSPDYVTDQINAALNATVTMPPPMPTNYKSKAITAPLIENKALVKNHAKSFSFNFGQPLWLAEKLTLDQRLTIFTRGA